jgi:hypothetical protein
MLKALVERVNATKLSEKDVDAENLLGKGFSGNSDAVYILAQSVLVQNIALEQARGQLEQAKQQIEELKQQPVKSGGFLGGLLGHHAAPQQQSTPAGSQSGQGANPQGYQQVYNPQAPEYQAPYQGGYAPQGGYQPPYQAAYPPPSAYGVGYGPPPPTYGGPMGGGSSFLRGAAQTAAGVAAGALAFEGVEALLHGGFGHPGYGMGMGGWGMPGVGFGMGPGMGMGFERPVEETVVNNYYDQPGGGFEHERGGEHFHDSADQGGGQLSDAGWQNDSGSGPNDGYDSSSSFDSGDSGGGWDSGGSDGGGGNFGDDGSI